MKNESLLEKVASYFVSDRSKRRIGFKTRSGKTPPSSKLRLEALESRELLAADVLSAAIFGPMPDASYCSDRIDASIPIDLAAVSDVVLSTTGTFWLVTSPADSAANPAEGTLRYAINNADVGDVITFDPSLKGQTITLNGSELTINKGITIDAYALYDADNQTPGVTIDAHNLSRVFNVSGGTSTSPVTLNGLTIINGKAPLDAQKQYQDGDGGGIFAVSGVVSISYSKISDNAYAGIGVKSATTTITNSTISENSFRGINATGGTLSLTNSAVVANEGEGIWAEHENTTVTATNTTVSGNEGDGIVMYFTSKKSLTLKNSIVAQNLRLNVRLYGAASQSVSNSRIGYNPGFVCAPVFDTNGYLYSSPLKFSKLRHLRDDLKIFSE